MANNSNPQGNLDYIYDLLSPYLDGEVTEAERLLVEQALAASPELQQELDSLRQTVTLVQALPQVAAPHPFTLTQADVQPIASPPQKLLWRMPAWAGSLALLATAIVCVLVAGVLFWGRQQFYQPASAPAEIAQMQQNEAAATSAAAPQEEAAAAAESRVEIEAEESAPEMEAAQEAPAEVVEGETLVEEKAEADEAAKESAADAAQKATEQGDLDTGGDRADQIAGATQATALPLVIATPLPLPSPTQQQLAAAAEAAEEEPPPAAPPVALETTTEQEAGAEEPAQAQAPAPQPGEYLYRDTNARLVEIQNQRLQVRPGLIDLEGAIDAPPGTLLQASLLRNEQLFEGWANPTTLQSIVQENGRFAFAIQADPNRADADLFAAEAANYQLTIIAPMADPPIIANIFFDTFGRAPASEQQATASPTPAPPVTPGITPIAQPTPTSAATVTPTTEAAIPQPVEPAPQSSLPRFIVAIALILVVVVVIIAGVAIWFNINKKS